MHLADGEDEIVGAIFVETDVEHAIAAMRLRIWRGDAPAIGISSASIGTGERLD